MTDKELAKIEAKWVIDDDASLDDSEEWVMEALELVPELIEEIKRLKRGEFTEKEFQALCHNFTGCDRKRFEKGCKEYQDKLFGYTCIDTDFEVLP